MRAERIVYLFIIPTIAMAAVIVVLTELDVPVLWAMVAGAALWGGLLFLTWPRGE